MKYIIRNIQRGAEIGFDRRGEVAKYLKGNNQKYSLVKDKEQVFDTAATQPIIEYSDIPQNELKLIIKGSIFSQKEINELAKKWYWLKFEPDHDCNVEDFI